jgi:hypothetical protein
VKSRISNVMWFEFASMVKASGRGEGEDMHIGTHLKGESFCIAAEFVVLCRNHLLCVPAGRDRKRFRPGLRSARLRGRGGPVFLIPSAKHSDKGGNGRGVVLVLLLRKGLLTTVVSVMAAKG